MAVNIKDLTPKHRGRGYTVILEVIGPAAEVNRWVENYMQEFHPCGYGTWVAARDELPGGRVRLTVRRHDSCD